MNGVLTQNRVVFLQFKPVGGVTTILGGMVTRGSGRLGTLKNNLNAVSFCHIVFGIYVYILSTSVHGLCWRTARAQRMVR